MYIWARSQDSRPLPPKGRVSDSTPTVPYGFLWFSLVPSGFLWFPIVSYGFS